MKVALAWFAFLGLLGLGLQAEQREALSRAQALLQRGNDQGALVELEAMLRQEPDNLFALGNVGLISARMGRPARAEQCLSRAHKLKPDDVQLGLALLEVEAMLGKKQDAARTANELVANGKVTSQQIWMAIQILYRHGDSQSAVVLAKQANAETADQHDLLGSLYAANGDVRAASDEMQASIRLDPQNDRRYFRLGMFYLQHRTPALAVLVFQHGIDKRADSALLWSGLGVSQCLDEKVEDSEVSLRKAIDLDPHFTDAYMLLGDILEQEKPREALGIFRRTVAEHPDLPIAYYYYGRLMILLNDEPISHAIAILRKAVALNPAFSEGHYELGRALEQADQNDAAAGQFEICLRQNPKFYKAHYRLAILYKKRGDSLRAAKSMKAFQEAQKLYDPDNELKRLEYKVEPQ